MSFEEPDEEDVLGDGDDEEGGVFLVEGDDEEDEAELLADGTLDPDEVDPLLEPWDEGADDEL